ncbi:MAG TPA: hypothetical protein VKR22_13640 [Acidimicrobiales bacterium]|nr:hypothetical protein [Acidimicrobiales bacterium]
MRSLATTYAYIIGQQGTVIVLNLAYWLVVTHFFAAAQVGKAFAATSIAILVSTLGSLGIATFLVAEINSFPAGLRRSVLSTGAMVSAAAVAVLAVLALAWSPILGRTVATVAGDHVTAAFFVVGAMGMVVSVLFDRAAIGLRRGPAQLTRGILASSLRIVAALVVLAAGWRTGRALVLGWSTTLVFSIVVCWPLLHLARRTRGGQGLRHRAALVRKYGSLSLSHHVLNLSLTAMSYFVPVVAAVLLVARQYAYFAAAQTAAVTVLAPTYLVAVALFAEGSRDERHLGRLVRHSFPIALAICAVIIGAVEVSAPLVLRLFGAAYANNGVDELRILAMVGLPYVVKDHFVSIRRAQGRLNSASRVLAVGTAAEAIGAVVGGAFFGVDGLCLGWVLVAAAEAPFLLPAVLQIHAQGRAEPERPGTLSPASGLGA